MEIKNKKSFKVLSVLVSIILAFLIGGLVFKAKYKLIDVPVSSTFLDKRSVIRNKDIKYIKVAKDLLCEDVILDENLLIGKYIKSDYYLNEGSFFYPSFIEDENNMNDIDYLSLDSNKTVFELYVKNISVNAAHLNKNMYVDLYLTLEKPYIMSDLFISGVMVCGLYNSNYEELNENSNNKNNTLSIISLVVDKDMVSLLNKGMLIGQISVIPCSDPYVARECFINRKGEIINYLN